MSRAVAAERNRAKKPEIQPRGPLAARKADGRDFTPSRSCGQKVRRTFCLSALTLYKPPMAPRKFHENSRSKGPKGSKGGRPPFRGKPGQGPRPAKTQGGKPDSRPSRPERGEQLLHDGHERVGVLGRVARRGHLDAHLFNLRHRRHWYGLPPGVQAAQLCSPSLHQNDLTPRSRDPAHGESGATVSVVSARQGNPLPQLAQTP